ncbi:MULTISPECIES: prolyl oligopeptidase family serine peptidase [unclassified Kaistella]|uniref:carboxylesterase family protein n=1 Tax=unclassified Kaistella TaxID=2762626 RepID=UPI002733B69F|nr:MULTISPECIES: prolyl oligopeptidase family serine peptidase [unclassified Kaistella]MDP2453087.1 prolyl oligopeptidase family serine peptidase [Kaistella sp. SH11-4b]MDP2456144.1 prolyl oligopeptidase family serine peptidase [Kaistella sp. SH40-3]MDP2458900.1 prolyl oligopeptidase family serine peptidase [Kaistella sp. SH19-2b]
MKFKYLLLAIPLFSLMGNAQEIKAELKKEVKKEQRISYILDYPENAKGKVPLMVFLHGSGERGNDLELVKAHSPFTYKNLFPEPVAILAPQCPKEVWWDTEAVYYLIKEIQEKYQIDDSRIMLTGLSMGGWGTLKLAMEHPELFSAVVPVCAPIDRLMKVRVSQYKDLPMKIYHGGNDDIVSPMNSIEIYQEIKKVNKNVELTIFPDDNHNSWDSTYSNPKLYEWMLTQKKNIVKK